MEPEGSKLPVRVSGKYAARLDGVYFQTGTGVLGVMVNFMCQLNWAKGCPDSWSNVSGHVWEDVSGRD